MPYIEGFLAPVYAGRKEEYRALCRTANKVILEHGAQHIVETYGDAELPEGKLTDFWRAVAADKAGGEGVVFSWTIWESKEARDAGWEKIMADDRMKTEDMPFDGKRMIFGGFELLYDSKVDEA